MNLKTDNEKIVEQLTEISFNLARIADFLENINAATNPLNQWTTPDDDKVVRTMYSNEDEEIVAHHLKLLGKELKDKK